MYHELSEAGNPSSKYEKIGIVTVRDYIGKLKKKDTATRIDTDKGGHRQVNENPCG